MIVPEISLPTGPNAAERLLTQAGRHAAAPHDAAEAARQFEAVFLAQFVDTMFSGTEGGGLFGGGSAEKMWRGFLAEHIADAYASRGGVGIADSVKAKLVEMGSGQ
jgi:Rod binding domain-containing protein